MIKCNIRVLMAERRIDSITDLIKSSGISRNSINKLWRNNEDEIATVKIETLIKLCNCFNCQLSSLIEYSPQETIK